MADPLYWRDKIVLAKVEAAYGVDPTPAGADAVLTTELTITPMEGSDVDRALDLPYHGPQGTIPTELHQKLSFRVELVGSGTAGTPPGWGALLRACGCAETVLADTSVTYNRVTRGHESVTFYVWIADTLHAIPGARGTVSFRLTAQQIPYLQFEFTGLFRVPVEAARTAPAYAGYQKPQIVSSSNTPTFTMGGTPFVLREAMLDLANAVEPRFLVGTERILITDHQNAFTARVEAVPVDDFDPYSLALAQTEVAVELVHGTIPGRVVGLSVPRAQLQRPQGLENAQDVVEWPLRMVPLATAGNDNWTLELT